MENRVRWPIDEQTNCKHAVLRSYLDGWFPILASRHKKLLFVDGFAGPGEYLQGEDGSPIIALDCVRDHRARGRLKDVEVFGLFIEEDEARADHLRRLLDRRPEIPMTKYIVRSGKFDAEASQILDAIDAHNIDLAPSFFMIDPFGVKGNSMELFCRILSNPRSEIFFSFMYEPIRRFKEQPEFEGHLTELFGTEEWKNAIEMNESEESKRHLHSLFAAQLKSHGAKFVVSFELWRGNRHIYTIYFATNNLKGCDLMKKSIWKEQPSGSYRLRAHANRQLLLFKAGTEPLAEQLQREFGDGWVRVETVEEFVMGDETPFHTGHLRRKTLTKMLSDGRLEKRPTTVRGLPSGKGIEIRFLGTP